MTLCQKLAAYLSSRPNEWIDGHALLDVGGTFAFRTRLSELRRPPFNMTIENRTTRHAFMGRKWTETKYRYVPELAVREAQQISNAINSVNAEYYKFMSSPLSADAVPITMRVERGIDWSCSDTHCDHCGLPNGKHSFGCIFEPLNWVAEPGGSK